MKVEEKVSHHLDDDDAEQRHGERAGDTLKERGIHAAEAHHDDRHAGRDSDRFEHDARAVTRDNGVDDKPERQHDQVVASEADRRVVRA